MNRTARRKAAVKAAGKLQREGDALHAATASTIVSSLDAARLATVDLLAQQPKDWQIAQAQAVTRELERQLAIWQAKATDAMKSAGDPAAEIGMRTTHDVLHAAEVQFSTAPFIPTEVVAQAFQALPHELADISAETQVGVGRILRQCVLGGLTPLDAMHQIGTIAGPTAKGPFRNASIRSEAIVRTELGRISQAANNATMHHVSSSLPGLQKEWNAVMDDATRETHADADGQRVAEDEPFEVGGYECDYPCDPSLPPEESINCRCMSLPYLPSFDETGSDGGSGADEADEG